MQPIADRERRAPRASLAWARAVLVAGVVVAVDQLSKSAIESSIVPGDERGLLPGIQLVDTRNKGVAFGFLPGSHVIVTILIGVALAALLVYFARHAELPWIWLPTGMLVGGALGNVADRLRHGSVTDFIKLPLGWPPFNLADSAITLGILILFVAHRPLAPQRPVTVRPALEIAFQDEHLLVVDKGPGLVVHPARGHREDTLAQLLAPLTAGGEPERAGIVHRLDRDTSGLLVVSRSQEVHRRLQAALAARKIEREYMALVEGSPYRQRTGRSRHRSDATRACARAWRSAASARGRRAPISRSSGALADVSLLRLRLETGRTHQIRVHLQAIGHPVVGDREYGTAGCSVSSASSCTPRASPSITP